MVQRYEQTRKLQWYKRGAAYEKKKKEVKDYVKNVRKDKKENVKNRSIETLSINTKLVQLVIGDLQ